MNSKFFFQWLCQVKAKRNGGFVTVFVIMIGLVMAILGVTMLVQATGDQTKAVSQKAKAESLNAAETGLERIKAIFADPDTRMMALYSRGEWNAMLNSDGTVNSGTYNGNPLSTTLEAVSGANSSSAVCSTGTPSPSPALSSSILSKLAKLKTLASAGSTTYEPIDSKYSYRLVSYEYAGSGLPDRLPGVGGVAHGRMVIEGKSTTGGDSISRVMVDIPISGAVTMAGGSSIPTGTVAPGLWLAERGVNDASKSETSLDMSSGTFDANVVLSNCTGTISDSYVADLNTAQVARGYKAERATTSMPSIPPIPSSVTPYALSSGSLPRSGEVPHSDGYYYYQTTGNLGDVTVDHTGGKKYRIYLNGNIPKTTAINNNCDSVAGCQPTDLQIFGMASNGEICMNGNSNGCIPLEVILRD